MSYPQPATTLIAAIIVFLVSHVSAAVLDDAAVVSVSGGEDHTLVLTADANLWACGYNFHAQLGVGDNTVRHLLVRVHDGNMMTDSKYIENIIAASAGWKHSLALDVNNHVWA